MRIGLLLASAFLLGGVALTGSPQPGGAAPRTQILFRQPSGMKIYWLTQKDGKTVFSNVPLETPGRFNFLQGAVYQLKLTHIPGRPGLELFPTLEIVRAGANTREFLTHNAVALQLTEEDFKQVVDGRSYIVKAVYLPHPRFQDAAGTEEVVSARLEPGQDPIREASRRGDLVLILRMGNIRKD